MLFSVPVEGNIASDTRNRHHAAFIQDTWRPTDRLSLNLGVRYEQQRTYFLESESNPALAGFFPSGTTAGRTSVVWNTWSPRLGLTFALAPRTVLKGHYGRYYINLADSHGAANPASVAWIRYAFLDPNANGLYDGPAELGAKLDELGATGTALREEGTPVESDLEPEYVDEVSISLEQRGGGRHVVPVLVRAQGPERRQRHLERAAAGRAAGRPGHLVHGRPRLGLPAERAQRRAAHCPARAGRRGGHDRQPDGGFSRHARRVRHAAGGRESAFTGGFLLRPASTTSGAMSFAPPPGKTGARSSPTRSWSARAATGGSAEPRPHVDARQGTTNWGARLLARYTLPYDVGLSANVRHQSGWPYAPIQRVDIPGTGTNQPIFLTDLSENRSENVTIVDLRLDKAFDVGASGRVSLMLDLYNLFNSNAVTNFSLRTGDNERVIAALDPLAMKLGVRYQF